MNAEGIDTSVFRFSSEDLPEKDRLAIWIEDFSRTLFKIDAEFDTDARFYQTASFRKLPGLSMTTGGGSALRVIRRACHVADGNDDSVLEINLGGTCHITQKGRPEVAVGTGDALLVSVEDAGQSVWPSNARHIALGVPRQLLQDRLPKDKDPFARLIPKHNEALRLLSGYLSVVDDGGTPSLLDSVPGLMPAFVTHVHDLMALMLGATRDAAHEGLGRGVRAARLHAIKSYIAANPGSSLSAAEVAAEHGISPRYLHMLFTGEGLSFTDYVIGQRLDHARRMLEDPRFSLSTVASIAFEAGFSGLSHFNRVFRQRFGMTPSDVRAQTKRGPF
jgi:AraC-like DNA-binding protein